MAKTNKRLLIILLCVPVLLLIPLVAMNFTQEVHWDLLDFIVAGILLLGTGLAIEFVLRKVNTRKGRIVLISGALFALVLVWMQLAVGIF